jgi:hypothetical protein
LVERRRRSVVGLNYCEKNIGLVGQWTVKW